MKVSSLLLILSTLLFVSAIGVAAYALIEINRPYLLLALGLMVLFLISIIGYRIYASSSRCPLCMGPILLSRQCSRSKKAKTSFGSYRFRVASDIILKNSFCCPYCGEPTKCEVKKSAEPESIDKASMVRH